MALFLDSTEITAKLHRLIAEADQFLYLVSPFIRLHHRLEDELETKKRQKDLKVVVLFGKNPDDPLRSMSEYDFSFFLDFPNIEIRYHEHLHAKLYASEDAALITSMNLYDFSQNNNIESGVMLLSPDCNTRTKAFGTDVDEHAYTDAIATYRRIFERSMLIHPSAKATKSNATGYCIRTGTPIPFNPDQPMSYKAWQSWAQFSNPDYPEKYCHKTGKPSHGKTSMRRPMLAH